MNPSISERTHSMPKLSKKAYFIKEYKAIVASWVRKAYICFCLDDEDSFEDEIHECMLRELAVLKESRYIFQGSHRQWETTWECVLYDGKYLTDDEFLSHFRMDWSCVMQLNSLVESDQEFRSVSRKLGKRSSMLHIMVLLQVLGSYGNEAELAKLGLMLGISKGAVNDYVRRACNTILKHCDQVIRWPSVEERKDISGRIRKAHGFINCLGLIDGTLFPLAFAPMVNGEDYYTRKGDYAIKGLVICNDAARITWVEWGGQAVFTTIAFG